MKYVHILVGMALLLMLVACGGAASEQAAQEAPMPTALAMDEMQDMEMEVMEEEAAMAKAPASDGDIGARVDQAAPQSQTERLIIKNADISMEVEDVSLAEQGVNDRVRQFGGYVVEVNTSGTEQNLYSTITFRVPAERFDDVLASVQELAVRIISRNVSGDDVTEEYVDLQSRLGNLQVTRDRLQELMEQATNVEDALNVNHELSNIQGQIEQIQGRMEYLQQSAALSTVSVSLQPQYTGPAVDDSGWNPLAVARDALDGLIWLGQLLVNILIVLLVWTPVWLPVMLLMRWLWGKLHRKLHGERTPTAPEPTA